jgi:hypothetical protein
MANIKVRFELDVKLDQSAINQMLTSPRGLVGQFILNLADDVAREARVQAPVKTGALRRNIRVEQGILGNGAAASVIADVDYAYTIHEGRTGSVTIHAKPGRVLRFPNKAGTIVYAPKVTQGPRAANPFLWRSLKDAVARAA